ncbi:MAG: hypothetical protein V4603_11115 [Pseudomonadota bacterium]
MRGYHWITAVIALALALTVQAQNLPVAPFIPPAASIAGGPPPQELAESIVIFIPLEDIPAIYPGSEDRVIKGQIGRVEKGVAPTAIVKHANTLTAPMAAGVPVTLFLIRQEGKDFHYPIYFSALAPSVSELSTLALAPAPEISVQVTTPVGAPVHAARLNGMAHSLSANIRIPADALKIQVDLYFGVIRPGGTGTTTWINAATGPALQTGMSPLLKGINMGTAATITTTELFGHDVEHVFTGKEPAGMYLLFALLVAAGADPSNTKTWLGVDMTPLFVE